MTYEQGQLAEQRHQFLDTDTDSAWAPPAREARRLRFDEALLRVRRTGSPAGRAALRDARLELERYGELPDSDRSPWS